MKYIIKYKEIDGKIKEVKVSSLWNKSADLIIAAHNLLSIPLSIEESNALKIVSVSRHAPLSNSVIGNPKKNR